MSSRGSFLLAPSLLVGAALLIGAPSLSALAAQQESAAEARDRIEAHLAENVAVDTLELLAEPLQRHPDDGLLFALASRVAEEAAEDDSALWYTRIAMDLLGEDKDHKDLVEQLEERAERLDKVAAEVADKLSAYDKFSKSLFDLGRNAARKKLYVNAVDLLNRCLGTSYELRALKELDELYADPKALTALLQARVDVPKAARSAEEVQRIAELDAAHSSWENAFERTTDNFVIKTNMGYEMAEEIAGAMEQMSDYFRQIFSLKGKTVPTCTIHVLKSRAEFDKYYPGRPPSVRGFYMPGQNLVVTYDPRTDGWSLSNLWSTLFHEAAHLFLTTVSKARIPGWLSEGTACYFEGARLMPNGSVLANDIPLTRLRGAAMAIEANSPSLEEVISFLANGSPPGSHYPPGWALVYFMNNYENERSEKTFRPLYEKFLKAYQKRAPKEEPAELFEKIIVKGSKEVESLEHFRNFWSNWLVQLHNRRLGGPAKTQEWLDLAAKQSGNRELESALESCRFAAEGDPRNLSLLMQMAEVQKKLKNTDGAAYNYRKVLRLVRDMDGGDEAPGFPGKDVSWLREEALDLLSKCNRSLGDVTRESMEELPAAAMEAAQAYVDGDLPRMALRILDDASAMLGGNTALAAMREDIVQSVGVEVRRWRHLDISEDLLLWKTTGEWWDTDGFAEVTTRGTAFASWRRELPQSFRFDVAFSAADREGTPFVGLHFGTTDEAGELFFGALDTSAAQDIGDDGVVFEKIGLFHLEEGTLSRIDGGTFLDDAKLKAGESVRFAVEVDGSKVSYFVNDQRLGSSSFRASSFLPAAGLFVDNLDWSTVNKSSELRFTSIRLFH